MSTPLDSPGLTREAFLQCQGLLARLGRLSCTVLTDSMRPFLREGDRVEIVPVEEPAALKRFEVIVFFSRDRLLCHFLWNHNRMGKRRTLTTRSLKECLHDDFPVGFDDLLGRVVDRKLPLWLRLKVICLNFLRRSA